MFGKKALTGMSHLYLNVKWLHFQMSPLELIRCVSSNIGVTI